MWAPFCNVYNLDNKKIRHNYTDEVVCPYCGYRYSDSWEFEEYHNPINCDACGKSFTFERIVDVTYSTKRIKEDI